MFPLFFRRRERRHLPALLAVNALALLCGPVFTSCAEAQGSPQTFSKIFTYTGGAQTFAVPADVTSVFVRLWGAGGSGAGGYGGGGAFVAGNLPVTPGSTLTLVVGGGGQTNGAGGYGGGASGTGVGGGGRSAIVAGGVELADAAGGGGAGGNYPRYPVDLGGYNGGPGGVSRGYGGDSDSFGGGGGTQAAGGTGGQGTTNGQNGSAIAGGSGWAGGGGGCFGGGGGATASVPYTTFGGSGFATVYGGGGGGSSLTSNLTGFTGAAGSVINSGGTGDPNYIPGVGTGGGNDIIPGTDEPRASTSGGNGEIMLTYTTSTQTLPTVTLTQATEAAFDAALAQVAQGGTIRFAFDGAIAISHTKTITAPASSNTSFTVVLDATGHNITLDGGNSAALFAAAGHAGAKASWTFLHVNLIRSGGNALTASYGDMTASDCVISYGGGVSLTNGGGAFTNCTFLNNISSAQGGAVNAVAVTASHCTFAGNRTAGTYSYGNNGGAVYTSGYATLSDCTFANNVAGATFTAGGRSAAGYGGAVCSGDAVTLSNCTFTGNVSNGYDDGSGFGNNGYGGAVYSRGAATAVGCTFLNNQSNGSGGALYSYNAATLSGCVFQGNAANCPYTGNSQYLTSCYGGALACLNASITNCAFLNNLVSPNGHSYSSVGGGAVGVHMNDLTYAAPTSNSAITNCTFAGNVAVAAQTGSVAQGGALYYGRSGFGCTLTNCTFANNNVTAGARGSSGTGGGVYNLATLTLVNTLLAGNTLNASGNNAGGTITDGGHNLSSDATCNFAAASTSKNNTDPLLGPLVYTGGGVPALSLLPGSPAIDKGDDTQAPVTDARGAARVGTSDIGAYERPNWQADAVAAAPDGGTRVLWNRKDGACSVWSVDANGSLTQSSNYGPYAGWTVATLSVGGDDQTRLLWRNQSGMIDIWHLATGWGSNPAYLLSDTHFGPYAGWTGVSIATGADNNTRLLWRNADGRIDLWNLDTAWGLDAARFVSDTHFGPYAGWTATNLSVGGDGHTRLLWNYSDGTANVWNVDTGRGLDAATLLASAHFGPLAGWTATSLSVGADNNTRLQWNNLDGTLRLWNVALGSGMDNSTLLNSTDYGPLTGYGMNALSAGADSHTRLLWNRTDGQLDLWSVDSLGNLLNSFPFGPF